MIWTEPNYGDTRIKHCFLWWPMTIKGVTRWLEWAKWSEQYGHYVDPDGLGITEWIRLEWLDYKSGLNS